MQVNEESCTSSQPPFHSLSSWMWQLPHQGYGVPSILEIGAGPQMWYQHLLEMYGKSYGYTMYV